jgi:hypothetical protein
VFLAVFYTAPRGQLLSNGEAKKKYIYIKQETNQTKELKRVTYKNEDRSSICFVVLFQYFPNRRHSYSVNEKQLLLGWLLVSVDKRSQRVVKKL